MKTTFSEFYPLNDEELKDIWKNSLFVFDTNVLLNFYRYSDNTVDEFFKLIDALKSRIWIPYHIGSEFQKERLSVIQQQAKVYDESIRKLNEIEDEFSNKNRNPFLSQELFNSFKITLEKIKVEFNDKNIRFNNRIYNDDVLDRLSEIFESNIGQEYDLIQLKRIIEEGIIRYKEKIPPGYEDKNKTDDRKFGDLIIWKQILDKAIETNKPIIFITDDRKEDWWLIQSNKIILPRPELRKEFSKIVNQLFYIYQPFKFLEYAKRQLSIGINEKTIEEVKELPPIDEEKLTNANVRDILITVIVKKNVGKYSIKDLTDLLNRDGYEVYWEELENSNIKFSIPIPNIPDLARRVKIKFTSQIERFGFQLIDFKPDFENIT